MKKFVDNLRLIRSLGTVKGIKFFNARRKFNPPKLEKSVKREIAYQLGLKKHRLQNKIFRITRYTTAFALLSIFVSSLFSIPGDTFHTVKQKTEDVRAVIQPGFKEELKMIRESKINITEQSEPDNGDSEESYRNQELNNRNDAREDDDASGSHSDNSGSGNRFDRNNDDNNNDD